MEFHAVEARRDRQLRCPAILFDDSGDFLRLQGAGCLERFFPAEGVDLPGDGDGRRCDGQGVVRQQRRVGHPPGVHELDEDAAPGSVDGIGHFPPARRLLFRVQAGRVSVPTPHRAGVRSLGDDEARRGSLRVVSDHPLGRDTALTGPDAGHGRHDDAVGQFQRPDLHRRKQPWLLSHLSSPRYTSRYHPLLRSRRHHRRAACGR